MNPLPAAAASIQSCSRSWSARRRMGPWNMTPTVPAAHVDGEPSWGHSTRPAVGVSKPASRCSSVDFPDPDGPTRATRSPAFSLQLAPCTATIDALPCP